MTLMDYDFLDSKNSLFSNILFLKSQYNLRKTTTPKVNSPATLTFIGKAAKPGTVTEVVKAVTAYNSSIDCEDGILDVDDPNLDPNLNQNLNAHRKTKCTYLDKNLFNTPTQINEDYLIMDSLKISASEESIMEIDDSDLEIKTEPKWKKQKPTKKWYDKIIPIAMNNEEVPRNESKIDARQASKINKNNPSDKSGHLAQLRAICSSVWRALVQPHRKNIPKLKE
ncbi:hypothetical protein AYI68_g3822 [Smittium mucronatum]|uniref:Uncharacterized protein n=1 Tax=Smittium mucronatum TaxID=133383 RepID=A0A1R0GYZ0_9FUNG|nr:hypothetical protein AYI68_g3822 [Smittium mucronatum]